MNRPRAIVDRNTLIGTLLVAFLGWLVFGQLLFQSIQWASYNWLFVLRKPVPISDASIVFLDEESHAELKQPGNAPWDRRLHARLIDRLAAAGAKAIVFDIVFLDSGRGVTEADLALAAAAKKAGNVIVGANPRPSRQKVAEPEVDLPFDALREAVDDRWGLVGMDPDVDQVIRRHMDCYPPFKPSMSWVAASFLKAPITQAKDDAELERRQKQLRWINYYGRGKSFANCSYAAALDPARVPDSLFRDRVVFVGASTLTKFSNERKDAYVSPFSFVEGESSRVLIPGVEIQALATVNLLRGDWKERLPRAWEERMIVAFGLFIGALMPRLTPTRATLAALLAVAAITGGALWMFVQWNLWFAWLIPILLVGIAWIYSIGINSIRLYVQNRLLEQSLGLHVSPKLVRKLMREGGGKFLKPGAEKQELTIFFSDIAGFTTIAEGLDSDELAHMMNAYFQTAVGQCIHPTDGTVVKYIGDAIFAFWNAPEPQADHAERACEAALRFREQPADANHGHDLVTRIGLHTGVANVGNFGSTTRVDYTALGESINLASRMEGLNKYLGTLTLLTGETHDRVRGKFVTRRLGRFILKGFEKSVEVHELIDRKTEQDKTSAIHEVFARSLEAFQSRRWPEARSGFEAVLAASPGDGPSRFLLKTIDSLSRNPPGDSWTGEIELQEK